jgi:hypothetical protein
MVIETDAFSGSPDSAGLTLIIAKVNKSMAYVRKLLILLILPILGLPHWHVTFPLITVLFHRGYADEA